MRLSRICNLDYMADQIGPLIDLGDLGDVTVGTPAVNDTLQWNGTSWENRADIITGNISLTGGEIRDTNGFACIEVITGGDVEINNGDLDVTGGNLVVSGAGNYLISQSGADVLLKGSNGLAVFQLDASLNSGNGAMSWGNIAPSEDWNVLVNGSERVSFVDINGTEEVGGKDTSLTTIGDIQCGGIVWAGDGSQLGLSVKTIIAGANEIYAAPHYTNIVSTSANWIIRVQGIPSGSGDYEVDIVAGGTRGTATYQWRVDGGSWSAIQTTTYGQTLLSQGVYIGWSGKNTFDAADSFTFTADSAPTIVFNVDTATPMVTISDLAVTNDINTTGAITASGDVTGDRLVASGTVESVFSADGDYELDNTTSSRTLSSMSRSIKYTAGTADNIPSILSGLNILPILDYTADVGAGGSDKSYAAQIRLTDTSSITQSATSKGSTETHLLRGIFGGSSLQGTYIMSAASINPYTIENIGAYFQATNTGTYNITAGAITADIIGGKFEGSQSNVTLTAGTPTFNIYGGYFSAVGTTDGTSTCYGAYISSSGADTNYGIYQASDVDNVIHGSLMVGAALAPSYTLEVNDTLGVTGVATLSGNAYPTITGTSGQLLETNGSGTLSWATRSAYGELYSEGDNLKTATSLSFTQVDGTPTSSTESGSVTDTQTINQTYYQVAEAGGASTDWVVDFTFDLDNDPGKVELVGRYDASAGAHNIKIQAYNYTTVGWDNFTVSASDIPNSGSTDVVYTFDYADLSGSISDYTNVSDEAQVRIEHASLGNANHDFYIDYIAIFERGITITTAGTYQVVTGLTAGQSDGVTLSGTNGTMTIVTAGKYRVDMSVSFSGTDDAIFEGHIFVDGSIQTNIGAKRKLGSDGDVGSTTFTGILDLAATDIVDVRFTSDSSGNYASIENINWNMTLL